METEIFRKKLIKLLKESKIYYIDFYGNINEIYDGDEVRKELQDQKEFLNKLRYLNLISRMTQDSPLQDSINYNSVVDEQIYEINRLEKLNTLDISEDASLDDIAEIISGICDNVDYNKFNDSTILSRLKKEKDKGLKYESKFLKSYSSK